MTRLLAILVWLAAFAGPAQAQQGVTPSANTPAPALAVRLGPTDFAGATLDANGLTGARWTGVRNLTLTGKLTGGFTCIQCANVTFEGVHADGGISLIQGGPFVIHRSDLTGAGVYAQRCVGLTITETLFHDLTAADVIDIPACDEVTIEWNAMVGGKPPPGSHPDAVQAFRVAGFSPKHVVVSHNFILIQGQGIFGVQGLTAESNLIRTPFQNAIYPDVDFPATIGGNVIASQPDGYAQASIIAKGPLITWSAPNVIGPWKAKPGFIIPPAPK